jgi:hypothetical protein
LISKKKRINIDWILEGEGPKNKNETRQENIEFDFLKDLEKWLIEESKKDSDIIGWFRREIRKKFPEFEEWKRKVDSEREVSLAQQQKIA